MPPFCKTEQLFYSNSIGVIYLIDFPAEIISKVFRKEATFFHLDAFATEMSVHRDFLQQHQIWGRARGHTQHLSPLLCPLRTQCFPYSSVPTKTKQLPSQLTFRFSLSYGTCPGTLKPIRLWRSGLPDCKCLINIIGKEGWPLTLASVTSLTLANSKHPESRCGRVLYYLFTVPLG